MLYVFQIHRCIFFQLKRDRSITNVGVCDGYVTAFGVNANSTVDDLATRHGCVRHSGSCRTTRIRDRRFGGRRCTTLAKQTHGRWQSTKNTATVFLSAGSPVVTPIRTNH